MSINLYFVRHGQSFVNLFSNIWNGVKAPLTELGREQAASVGEELKKLGVVFDAVYCSPYERAKETCTIALDCADFDLPVRLDKRVGERKYDGLVGERISDERFQDLWNLELDPKLSRDEKIEPLSDLQERTTDFLLEIKKRHRGGNVLVFSHGGFGLMVKSVLEEYPEGGKLYLTPILRNGELMMIRY